LLEKQAVGRTHPELITSATALAATVDQYDCFQALKFTGCPMPRWVLHRCCCLPDGTVSEHRLMTDAAESVSGYDHGVISLSRPIAPLAKSIKFAAPHVRCVGADFVAAITNCKPRD
jgi:hypothetical protein